MITSKEQLPLVLHAEDICEIMQIGKRQLYELLEDPPFIVHRTGGSRRIAKIPKESFFHWFEGKSPIVMKCDIAKQG